MNRATPSPGRGPGRVPASRVTRRCAASGCQTTVRRDRLMCPPDWRLVPRDVQARIWATWRGGPGVITPEYQQAVADAISAVKARKADQS